MPLRRMPQVLAQKRAGFLQRAAGGGENAGHREKAVNHAVVAAQLPLTASLFQLAMAGGSVSVDQVPSDVSARAR